MLAEQMNADALEAMKLTRKYFVVELDFSEPTIEQIDKLIGDIDFSMPGGKSDENTELLTRSWGAYVGEVLRRHADGEWSISDDGKPLLKVNSKIVSSHEAVRGRLTDCVASLVEFYEQASKGN